VLLLECMCRHGGRVREEEEEEEEVLA